MHVARHSLAHAHYYSPPDSSITAVKPPCSSSLFLFPPAMYASRRSAARVESRSWMMDCRGAISPDVKGHAAYPHPPVPGRQVLIEPMSAGCVDGEWLAG